MTKEEFFLGTLNTHFEPPKKARKKPPKYPLDPGTLERYNSTHVEWFKKKFPSTYKDGHYVEPKIPDYQTANGLTTWISNYMDWSGGDGNRINTAGRQVDGRYIKSTTKLGTADTSCIHPLNGVTFYVEVKAGKDTPSPDQLIRQAKIRKSGGIYEFVKTPMDFFRVYDKVGTIIVSKPFGLFD